MFTLLSADQQRELAQFVLERTTGCINFTDVPYQTIFRGKYSIPQKMNHPLTETRSGDLYFKALAVRIAELKAQAADFDPVELYKARQVIRPAQEKAAEQQLEDAMHEKPSLIMLLSAKQETSHLLGADAEERQARQLIMHRNQEQYRNSLSKRKRNDPER